MFKAIIYFVINVFVVLILAWLIPGFEVTGFWAAAVFLFILSLLQWTIVPVLKILTFPINFLSLGLIGLLINLAAIWFVANNIQGIGITGSTPFLTLILVALGLSIGKSAADQIATSFEGTPRNGSYNNTSDL